MRISKLLIESVVSDVFGDTFETFISDYNVIYSNDIFVAFTDNAVFNIADLPVDTSTGMYLLFPIEDVIEKPAKYTDYAEKLFLHVVKAKNILNISDVTMGKVKHLSKIIGLDKEDFDKLLVKFSDNYKTTNPSIESYIFSKLLFNDVTITDEDFKLRKVSNTEVERRIKKLGYNVITQDDESSFLLSKERKLVAYPVSNLKHLDKYSIKKTLPKEAEKIADNTELYYRDHKYMREVAQNVAQGLGSKLNADPLYSLFLDYYFWTTDGIEIVITVAFSETEVTSTHDNVYYIVEADTPYGILVHRINADKNLDNIKHEIEEVYKSHVTPNENWEAKNRDIFLDQERKEYKLFDLHYEDVSKVVDEYYPKIYNLARTYNIALPVLSYYGSFDKLYLHQFIEFLASNPTPAVKLMKELEDKEYDFNNMFFVPMPKKITMDILKNIALIYSEMKKRKPSAKGWYLFKEK